MTAVGVCALTGCSLFVSLDGLNDGGVSDASTANDASTDVTISDSPTSDSPITSADSGDAGACSGFCDNFDDRTTVQGAWDNANTNGNGQPTDLTIASDEFVSPPHSLHVHVPARPTSGGADISNLNENLPLTGGSMSIDLDVKVVGSETGFDGFCNLMELNVGGDYAGSITLGGGGNTVVDYWVNFSDGGHLQPLFDLGTNDTAWHHFHYAAHYDSTDGSILVTRDGVTVGNVTGSETYGAGAAPAIFNMSIGYSSQPTSPAYDVYFDNIQVQ